MYLWKVRFGYPAALVWMALNLGLAEPFNGFLCHNPHSRMSDVGVVQIWVIFLNLNHFTVTPVCSYFVIYI